MSIELLSMLGGGVTGFVMRLIASQAEAQAKALEGMLAKQNAADDSADRAAARNGGVWVRRAIAGCILFAVVIAPFILAFYSIPVSLENERTGLLNFILGSGGFQQIEGFVLLPEVRQGMLALLSFYFGSSMVKR
jgi:hypothetical protein